MAQNVANEKWAGNVTLSPWSFTIDANRLIIATSQHNFRVENRTTRNVGMRADYHFILWQADHNNQYKINLKELSHEGPITVPKVTLTDPMKRGLKGNLVIACLL